MASSSARQPAPQTRQGLSRHLLLHGFTCQCLGRQTSLLPPPPAGSSSICIRIPPSRESSAGVMLLSGARSPPCPGLAWPAPEALCPVELCTPHVAAGSQGPQPSGVEPAQPSPPCPARALPSARRVGKAGGSSSNCHAPFLPDSQPLFSGPPRAEGQGLGRAQGSSPTCPVWEQFSPTLPRPTPPCLRLQSGCSLVTEPPFGQEASGGALAPWSTSRPSPWPCTLLMPLLVGRNGRPAPPPPI